MKKGENTGKALADTHAQRLQKCELLAYFRDEIAQKVVPLSRLPHPPPASDTRKYSCSRQRPFARKEDPISPPPRQKVPQKSTDDFPEQNTLQKV